MREMTVLHRTVAAGLALTLSAVVVGGIVIGATPVAAGGPPVSGAGSTWVEIALDQWRADIAREGYTINYSGGGSSTGRQLYIENKVDFAASEIPFYPYELATLSRSYQYVPDVAGGTSLMYNLHAPDGSQITSLRLDAATAGEIFTGQLTSWQDPAIQALNPGLVITEQRIVPVMRSDGSGTSAQFSLYLAAEAPSVWNPFAASQGCPAPCSFWPPAVNGQHVAGSDGVANFVSTAGLGSGSIGYLEAGYAFGRGFPIAHLRNAYGNFVPTQNSPVEFSSDVATALKHATLKPDLEQDLTGVYAAPEANAYPMSSYSYLITQTSGFDPAKGFVLGTWMIYIACAGQREATPLGYSPMPPNLVAAVFAAVQRIPGAPKPPPLDPQDCPNPTVTGQGTGSGGSAGSSRGGAGGNGAGTGSTATAAAAASGPSAVTGGLGDVAGGVGSTPVATLSPTQRKASFVLAEQAMEVVHLGSGVPLLVAAIVVTLAIVGPAVVIQRRRHG